MVITWSDCNELSNGSKDKVQTEYRNSEIPACRKQISLFVIYKYYVDMGNDIEYIPDHTHSATALAITMRSHERHGSPTY